jgi:transcriptional regulator with XRE-family HTH domain
MTPRPKPPSPLSRNVARRVRELREQRGMTVRELAERLAEVGAGHLDRAVLTNLETERRQGVTIDELAAFETVFGVPMAHFLVPSELLQAEEADRLIKEWRASQAVASRANVAAREALDRVRAFARQNPDLQETLFGYFRDFVLDVYGQPWTSVDVSGGELPANFHLSAALGQVNDLDRMMELIGRAPSSISTPDGWTFTRSDQVSASDQEQS